MRLAHGIVVCLLLLAAAASAELYTWVDASGTTHLTQHMADIPPEFRDGVSVLGPPSRVEAEAAPEAEGGQLIAPTARAASQGDVSEPRLWSHWAVWAGGGFGLLIVLGAVLVAAGQDEDSSAFQVLAWLLAFALMNGALWSFGSWAAPRIWSEEGDRHCQEQGYWYERGSVEDALCERWYLIPIPRLRR